MAKRPGRPKLYTDEELRERKRLSKAKQIQKARDYVDEYKRTHPREICGESHIGCLQFHHLDRDEKSGEMSKMVKCGIKKTKEEISKCQVLCANCHMKLHYEENKKG